MSKLDGRLEKIKRKSKQQLLDRVSDLEMAVARMEEKIEMLEDKSYE